MFEMVLPSCNQLVLQLHMLRAFLAFIIHLCLELLQYGKCGQEILSTGHAAECSVASANMRYSVHNGCSDH